MSDRLFTARFFIMCGFTFTVFLSAFQLLPTTPFRILDLGGSSVAAGLFLGLLTYASAVSAPLTGAVADRVGRRKTLIVASVALTGFSLAYAASRTYWVPLVLVVFHGAFWSALLSASAAYLTDIIPPSRRAEGISYWGLATVVAVAVAPSLGFALYHLGWVWLCLGTALLHVAMTVIAVRLPREDRGPRPAPSHMGSFIEWRVLGTALTLFLYSFGYGGITSFVALYAADNGAPRALFFTTFALVTLVTRPFAGRLADRVGYARVFVPCLVLITIGLGLLSGGGSSRWIVASAFVFGVGFGSAYPVFAAHVLSQVPTERRGAAFGAILAAFDTGIGTGSIVSGWIIGRWGFATAFTVAAVLSALALPYYILVGRRFLDARPEDLGLDHLSTQAVHASSAPPSAPQR